MGCSPHLEGRTTPHRSPLPRGQPKKKRPDRRPVLVTARACVSHAHHRRRPLGLRREFGADGTTASQNRMGYETAPGGGCGVENRGGYRNGPIPSRGWPGSRGAKRFSSEFTL
jgi:hypothetical protein